MALGLRQRYEILKRDNFTCLYCGASPPQVELEVDHVRSRSNGGGDKSSNLITACVPCNQGKRAASIECCLSCVRPLCRGPLNPRDGLEASCGCWCHVCKSCLEVSCPMTDNGHCIEGLVAEAEIAHDVAAEEEFSF